MEHAEPPESLRVALLDEADGAGIEAAAAVLERGFHQDDGFHRTLGLTGSDMAGYWRRIVTLFCRSDGAFVVLALDGDDVVGVLLATRERFFPRGTATVDYLRATVRAVGWLRAARVMVLGQRFERKARRGGAIFWLRDLAVLPEAQNRGIGRRLLGRAADLGRAEGVAVLQLEVLDESDAVRLYLRAGYVEVGRFTAGGRRWLIMRADIVSR